MEIAHKLSTSGLFNRRKQSKQQSTKNGFPDGLAKLETPAAPIITTSSPSVDNGHYSTDSQPSAPLAINGAVEVIRKFPVERLHVDYVPSWKPDRRYSSPAVRHRRSPSPRKLNRGAAGHKSKGSTMGGGRGLSDSYRNRACSLPEASVRRASSARTERDWKENNNSQQRSPLGGRVEQRFLQLPESSEYDKLRSFGVNKKGELVDQGYCYRHRSDTSSSESVALSASPSDPESPLNRTTIDRQTSDNISKKYCICVIGGVDVGKTSLINQFQNCELANVMGRGDSLEGETERILSILIGGVEVELCFIEVDVTLREVKSWQPSCYTGVIVLYTVTSKRSFSIAADALYRLRCENLQQENVENRLDEDIPVILVGNKIDLERQRIIQENDGKELAKSYDCRFLEISVGLGHRTDDLLKSLLLEIRKIESDRLKPNHQRRKSSFYYKKRKSMTTVTARKPRANSLHNVPIFGSIGRRLARSCEDMIARLWRH